MAESCERRDLPSSIFPFLLFSLSLPFFVFFNPRDFATVRVHDRSRSATKFFGFLRFRLDIPLPLGSLGEIDRKLFDIFALWRIRTGDNCAWNHISFPFPSTLPTQRSTFLARVYTLCVNYHDSRENVKQFLYWPPETRERNLFVHDWKNDIKILQLCKNFDSTPPLFQIFLKIISTKRSM